jgi:hypothetical protein
MFWPKIVTIRYLKFYCSKETAVSIIITIITIISLSSLCAFFWVVIHTCAVGVYDLSGTFSMMQALG